MTILLYKNGQWLIDGEQPLEGVSLDNLAAILTDPKDGDIVKYDESSGMWVAGDSPLPAVTSSDNGKVLGVADGAWAKLGGGGSLPPVTEADNGKVLAVEDGAWAASEQGKKFIVTLTPTALDYSGTMDKTPEEISAAYEDGMEIVFRVTGVPSGTLKRLKI